MAFQFSTTARNASLDAIETAIGASAIMRLRTGAVPANCGAADSGTVIATINLPSDWMAAASGGSKAASGTWQDASADASGIIALIGAATALSGSGVTGNATGSLELIGASAGLALVAGTASGGLGINGTAQGIVASTATAIGDIGLTGIAEGSAPIAAAATGSILFAGVSGGSVAVIGDASGILSIIGTARARARDNLPAAETRTANDNREPRIAASADLSRTAQSTNDPRQGVTAVTQRRAASVR